jgi:predicted DNA-binding transcriptional regulator AlpA
MQTAPNLPLTAQEAAAELGISPAAFWRAVATGRMPAPCYPAPRAPWWYRNELSAALAATRALPSEAKASRKASRLAAAG